MMERVWSEGVWSEKACVVEGVRSERVWPEGACVVEGVWSEKACVVEGVWSEKACVVEGVWSEGACGIAEAGVTWEVVGEGEKGRNRDRGAHRRRCASAEHAEH